MVLDVDELKQTQVSQYWDDGYVFPMQAVSPQQAGQWRDTLEAIEAKWLDNGLPLPLNTYKRVNAQCVMPLACEIGLNPDILDIVEGVMGSDIMLYSVEFLIKESNTRHVVTMHQDVTYWGMGDMDKILTAWVALSPATEASGCMDFVKGSHKNPILPHEDSFDENNLLSRGQEIAVDIAEEDKVKVELQPGQMSLHHGLTIHGSGPNSSDDRRIGAVLRYINPSMKKSVGGQDYAIPARGDHTSGDFKTYAVPDADFTDEGLRVYNEIRDVQTSVMMAGANNEGIGIYAKAK